MGQSGVGGLVGIAITRIALEAFFIAFSKLVFDDLKLSLKVFFLLRADQSNGDNFHGSINFFDGV